MPFALSRAALRQSQFLLRRTTARHASSTTEAASNVASKAQESGSQAVSKASQGLSRVTSSAGPAISGIASRAGGALKGIGGRTGRLIGFVESLIPPTIYYSRVALELSKLVFQGQKMSPPDIATFQSYFQPLLNTLRNPSTLTSQASATASSLSPNTLLSRIRNLNSAQWATVGVASAEVLGFFTVGEMIGRFKLVGYNGEPAHGH